MQRRIRRIRERPDAYNWGDAAKGRRKSKWKQDLMEDPEQDTKLLRAKLEKGQFRNE